MSPESASALIDWFMNHFTSTHEESIIGAIVYEMFGLQDTFGQAMLNNLRVSLPVPPSLLLLRLRSQPRNVSLYTTLRGRFTRYRFMFSYALTLSEVREKHIGHSELERDSFATRV